MIHERFAPLGTAAYGVALGDETGQIIVLCDSERIDLVNFYFADGDT